uniref:Uncharacterized protein n=1 Tax=Panagrolaimus sp. ES5 TaxID=591445 RepID=A0AC34FJB1_9BILA
MNTVKMNKELQDFELYLEEVDESFDANLLYEFILKNATTFCKVNFVIGEENDEEILSKLASAEEEFQSLEEWKNKHIYTNFDM